MGHSDADVLVPYSNVLYDTISTPVNEGENNNKLCTALLAFNPASFARKPFPIEPVENVTDASVILDRLIPYAAVT